MRSKKQEKEKSRSDRGTARKNRFNKDFVELTFSQISAVLEYKHGWVMSTSRVEFLCRCAEKKLRERLMDLAVEVFGFMENTDDKSAS